MVDQMRGGPGAARQRAPQPQPAAPQGDIGSMIYDRLMAILNSGVMDEASMQQLAQLYAMQNAYGQQQEFELGQGQLNLQQDQLAFARDELGFKGDQLAQAMREFEFESGPVFEFYKQERGMQHDATMLGHQSAMQQSQDDVLRSANYLQQARYQTDAAQSQRDIAQFQAMQTMGMIPPDTSRLTPGLQPATPGILAQKNLGY